MRCGWEEWAGIAAEIIPKMSSNAGQSLSHGLWPCQLPLHKGAFGDGGCGLPRWPCGPPRNDIRFLSFQGAERRGNPSFLRWTMDGGSGRPTKDEGRHAGSSCPTGGCGEPPRLPWVAAHSGVSAPAGARDGWESRQRPSPKGASNAGQSLSHGEAVTAPVVPRAWPPSIKFQNGIWTSVTVPKILCSHTPTEF